ncbi:MAG: hemerythrin domain-containing protein [Nitrosospira sp.]
MPTAQSTIPKAHSRTAATRLTKNNAIKLLTDDHVKVKKMFKEFEKLCKKDDNEAKGELAAQICTELTIHTQLEEEIFYPAAREAIDDDDLMNEALVEHASAKDLIAQIQAMRVSDPMYVAVVTVLGEYINHHVEEEQNELFPKVKKTKIDLEELGTRMANLKETLQKE